MPRWLRIFLTGLSFLFFFLGGGLLGAVAAPFLLLLGLGRRGKQRDRMTRLVNASYGFFLWWMKLVGLISYDRVTPPAELKGRGYVLVSNHPTLIDVLYLLNWFPRLTCVVKASWYGVWFFGTLLRGTHYLPGPGVEGDDVASSDAEQGWGSTALTRMVAHLESGHPLLAFPEGTRSKAARLRRFRRGPFEAARRAGVPIVPVFVHVDRPFLMKGVPFWKVPSSRARFDFEVWPLIDPNEYSSGRELRNALQSRFEERFQQSLRERLEGPRSVAGERALEAEAASQQEVGPASSSPKRAEARGAGGSGQS